jgi:rhodanese-related sulfurtransferase
MRRMLLRALALVLLGATLGLAVNAARPSGLPLRGYQAPSACAAGAAPAEIGLAEAAALCGAQDVVVADARDPAAFAEGHIAGAVHLPCKEANPADMASVLRSREIVVYGQSTDDARPVAAALQEKNPAVRVSVLKGGFAAWNAAGLACASGACEECKAVAK